MGVLTSFLGSSRKVRGKFLEVVPGAARFYAHVHLSRHIPPKYCFTSLYGVHYFSRIFIISWFEVLLDHPQV